MIRGKKTQTFYQVLLLLLFRSATSSAGIVAGSFLRTPSASGRNPRQRARKNVSHTGCWQAHVPGRNEVLVTIPWDFPLRTRPLDRGWVWDQSLELQQQFERTRDSVSTGHLSYCRVSGVTLSRATHIWGHLVTPRLIPFPLPRRASATTILNLLV